MERKEFYDYTGIPGEATGIGQGRRRNRSIQGVGSMAEEVFIDGMRSGGALGTWLVLSFIKAP